MAVAPDALRAALEASLAEDPDDRATRMAYADLLTEQGEPRGEFVRVQLALEDESLPAGERRKLQAREKQLLKEHEREWLGPLAPYLLDKDTSDLNADSDYYASEQHFSHRWQGGFLTAVEVRWLTRRLAQALADAPAAALLRELRVGDDAPLLGDAERDPPPPRVARPEGARYDVALYELIGSRCLGNLRVFQVGHESGGEDNWTDCHCYLPGLEAFVRELPRVEELVLLCKSYDARKLFALENLNHLRVLRAEHLDESHPVRALAGNPALSNLTHLWFHPHYWEGLESGEPAREIGYLPLSKLRALVHSRYLKKLTHLRWRLSSAGDEGARLLAGSGFLERLKLLDLRHGCVTDEGARVLAACPATRGLELLDLSRNQLTTEGIQALRAAGVNLRADDQHPPDSCDYLMEGDFE
jgi:uncharacterized protein (TIGR02996 family)